MVSESCGARLSLAQANLGVLYRDGRGVPQDHPVAVMWFRKAADQGDAVAQYLLAEQYAKGGGVSQDFAEAVTWFRKAAEQGIPSRGSISGNVRRRSRRASGLRPCLYVV